MKIAAVIAEFNPLHKGHVLPLQKARQLVGADGAVLCIMSGNVVQRGDFAIFSKQIRTQAALMAGADLVIELPAVYALSSAQYFAQGAVALIDAMGMEENHLVFGSELGEVLPLLKVAQLLETPKIQKTIQEEMKKGISYGMACQNALIGTGDVGESLKSPNNLLGIAYLRAILSLGAKIEAHTIKRVGVSHDAKNPQGEFASATYIRQGMLTGAADFSYMPQEIAHLFEKAMETEEPISFWQEETMILALLRGAIKPKGGFLGDSEGLAQKIINSGKKAGSVEELFHLTKSKRYHLSRIRRLILSICLGFTGEDRPPKPPYIRVLGANITGQAVLAKMRKTASLPIIIRPGQAKQLQENGLKMFTLENKVTDLRGLCSGDVNRRKGGQEWRESPIILR